MCTNVRSAWSKLVASQRSCRRCSAGSESSLLHEQATPLFGRFTPWTNGLLFVFEAPNLPDTVDSDKGYLTYDQETDPTGRFARTLMVEELGLNPQYFQVTNAVLCLPNKRGVKFPVSGRQVLNCSFEIAKQIQVLNPVVVVPVGAQALKALNAISPHEARRLSDAVATPVAWNDRWLFPVYHTGRLGRIGPSGRPELLQRRDWFKLRQFAESLGVVVPPITT